MRTLDPTALARIQDQAEAFAAHAAERAETAAVWAARVAEVARVVPSARIGYGGETVDLGDVSPGCVACAAGTWDCVFVTMRCNLSCAFCLRPRDARLDAPRSALGDDPTVLAARYEALGVTGASFSGGEPFLEPETVLAWVRALRAARPALYLWAYTNGLPITVGLLDELAEAGLDELRFDVAAAGYGDAHVARMLAEATARLPAVAVEVPAVPADREAILGSLDAWAAAGVRYLNLHELVFEPGTSAGDMPGARVDVRMPDGHRCQVDPRSEDVTLAVLERVAATGLPLAVNDCSLRTKARQLRGRRRLLAPLSLLPGETSAEDGTAVSEVGSGGLRWRATRLLPLDPAEPGEFIALAPMPEVAP